MTRRQPVPGDVYRSTDMTWSVLVMFVWLDYVDLLTYHRGELLPMTMITETFLDRHVYLVPPRDKVPGQST